MVGILTLERSDLNNNILLRKQRLLLPEIAAILTLESVFASSKYQCFFPKIAVFPTLNSGVLLHKIAVFPPQNSSVCSPKIAAFPTRNSGVFLHKIAAFPPQNSSVSYPK